MKQNIESRNKWIGFTCRDLVHTKMGTSNQQENKTIYLVNGLRTFWLSMAELVEGNL